MAKTDLLNFLKDINYVYNDCGMYDCVSKMLEDFEAEIRAKAYERFAEKFIYKVHCEGCSGCTNCYETGTQDNCDTYRYFAEVAEELKAEQLKGESE